MKNVVLVFKGNNALALDNTGATIKKTSTGSFLANLETLTEVLNTIPVGDIAQEVTTIYIPDFIQGIASGTALDYIRTGKTKSGTQLTAQEIQAFKDLYKMISERIYNVRFSLAKFIPKNNTELITLRTNAYNALINYSTTAGISTGGIAPVQQIVDTDKALREALDAQIIEAINKGDMDKMMQLKTMRDTLKEPTIIQGTSVSQQQNNSYVSTPSFGMDNSMDKTENNTTAVENSNDQPITTPEQTEATVKNTDADVSFTNTTTTDASNINWANV